MISRALFFNNNKFYEISSSCQHHHHHHHDVSLPKYFLQLRSAMSYQKRKKRKFQSFRGNNNIKNNENSSVSFDNNANNNNNNNNNRRSFSSFSLLSKTKSLSSEVGQEQVLSDEASGYHHGRETRSVFSQLMRGGHKLRTYRLDFSEGYPGDLPSIYSSTQTASSDTNNASRISTTPYRQHDQHSHGNSNTCCQHSNYNSKLSRRSFLNSSSSAPSLPSRINSWSHRLSDSGTPNQPFSAKLHPNFITADGWCFLCGAATIGGKDHHASFDRDHIALSYFLFLVCSMKREWDAQGVFRESAVEFPHVWDRIMSPPLKFSRYYMNMMNQNNTNNNKNKKNQNVKNLNNNNNNNVDQNDEDDLLDKKKLAVEKFEFQKEVLSPYMKVETLDPKQYAFVMGVEKPTNNNSNDDNTSSKKTSNNSNNNNTFSQNQNLLLQHQVNSTSAFSSPESVKRALRLNASSTMTNADLERELQKFQGNLATSFAPTWWTLFELHQRRIELQSLLTVAMDESDFFDRRLNRGGKLATRSVCAQLPPGLIGQGEKTFRADVTRVVAATLPVAAPMVQAAFAQKAWGRTNLSRLYDSLHIERIHEHVLLRPVVPRNGRSEKSGVLRQLLTELHYASSVGREVDWDDEEDEGDDDDVDKKLIEVPETARSSLLMRTPRGDDEEDGGILGCQMSEMILARLGSEAVLTMSHIYMERAWRVAALMGFPTPEELDRLDYG